MKEFERFKVAAISFEMLSSSKIWRKLQIYVYVLYNYILGGCRKSETFTCFVPKVLDGLATNVINVADNNQILCKKNIQL